MIVDKKSPHFCSGMRGDERPRLFLVAGPIYARRSSVVQTSGFITPSLRIYFFRPVQYIYRTLQKRVNKKKSSLSLVRVRAGHGHGHGHAKGQGRGRREMR